MVRCVSTGIGIAAALVILAGVHPLSAAELAVLKSIPAANGKIAGPDVAVDIQFSAAVDHAGSRLTLATPDNKFIPLDIGTYFVASRSRPWIKHLVSIIPDEHFGCSCESFEFGGEYFPTCAHIREACRKRRLGKLPMIVGMKGR